VDRLAVAEHDLAGAGELRPVGVAHRAAREVDHGHVVLRDLAIRPVHLNRVADAAEVDELPAHPLARAQCEGCAFLRVHDAGDDQRRGAERAENRPLPHVITSLNLWPKPQWPRFEIVLYAWSANGGPGVQGFRLIYLEIVRSALLDNGLRILIQEL